MSEFAKIYKTDLSDRQLMQFWCMVQASGRARDVAYCMEPQTPESFVRWMRKDDVEPWIILHRGVPAALYFQTDRQGKSAQGHFCTLPQGMRRTEGEKRLPVAVAAILYALGSCLWLENESGGHYLDTIIGITPVCNKAAINFTRRIGGQPCGMIPGGCWYHDTNENVPGLVTVYTRESVPFWATKL